MDNILYFGCSFGSRCLLRLTRLLNYFLTLTYRLFTFWNIKIVFVLLQNRSFFDVIRKQNISVSKPQNNKIFSIPNFIFIPKYALNKIVESTSFNVCKGSSFTNHHFILEQRSYRIFILPLP